MNKFLERLTRENWGFPWHIILAQAGSMLSLFLLPLLIAGISPALNIIFTALIINLVGIVHEIRQNKSGRESRRGSIQDIAANNTGILIAVLEFLLISAR